MKKKKYMNNQKPGQNIDLKKTLIDENNQLDKRCKQIFVIFIIVLYILSVAFALYELFRAIPQSNYSDSIKTVVIAILCFTAIVIAVSILILKRNTLKIENLYAVTAILLGMLYMFTMTPLSPPDEAHHYQSAYEVSNILRLHWDNLEYGYVADFDYTEICSHNNVGSAYHRIIEDLSKKGEKDRLISIPNPRDISYPLEYIPQAMGISIAKLLNANFIITFFAGRLCNLLFFVLCTTIAVKTTPRFKLLFCMIGLLPMTLHQGASYSYDGFINGMSFLLISLFLRSIYSEKPFEKAEAVQIAGVGALLAPAKIVYCTILLLALLIPKERFQNSKKRIAFVCCVWGFSFAVALLFMTARVFALVGPANDTVNWDGGKTFTPGFVLYHPLRAFSYFLRAIKTYGTEWFEGSIGISLSGLTLLIDRRVIYCFTLMLFIASLEKRGMSEHIRNIDRVFFLIISLVIKNQILIEMDLYFIK